MRDLLIGFTPDPDDAFAYHALVHGHITIPGCKTRFITEPIESLNQRAAVGELDVAAISSVHYPHIAGSYRILRSGASVGRGYGPALVARSKLSLSAIPDLEVAVPGETTTGATLLRLFFPGVRTRFLPFEKIRAALAVGQVEAGVLIHEELLSYPEDGLYLLLCLGKEWESRTRLPLPVGLNVVHRRLGSDLVREVARVVRDSILRALQQPREAMEWARIFGRGPSSPVALRFISMFANSDTAWFPSDCEVGLQELFTRLHAAGLTPCTPVVRLVDPAGSMPRTTAATLASEA